MLLYFPLNSLPFLKIFAEGHTELQAASGASLEVSTMAEDMTNQELSDCSLSQPPPQPEPEQELLAELHFLDSHSCEKATATKDVNVDIC